MRLSIDEQEIEFDLSPKGISLFLLAAGLLLILFGEFTPDHSLRPYFYNLMLLSMSISVLIFTLSDAYQVLMTWFSVAAISVMVLLAVYWLNIPAILILLVVPIILVSILSGLRAMLAFSFADILLLIFLSFFLPEIFPFSTSIVTIFAICALSAVQVSIFRQVYDLSAYSINYWKKGKQYHEFAQESQLKLEKALQTLANANQLLIQTNRRAERMRFHAENAEKTKAMFVARVSHEFRTPLNMIIGLVELMVESPHIYSVRMPPELEKDLEIVLRNCKHLANMIDDVLELTRAESGSLSLHRDWVNLFEIISEASQVVSPLIDKKGLELEIQMNESMPEVYCDRIRIRQVVLNLVSNAARFTLSGKITINLQITGEIILVSIADTGPGIALEYAERIFEPFYQGAEENTWKEKGGSGLGLTISKQFVEYHGGQMWLKSQAGVGSTFFFTLPVQERPEFSVQPGQWIRPDWIWHEGDFKSSRLDNVEKLIKPHILILDETHGLLSQFDHYCDPFNLVVCQDVHELLKQAQENQPDLIWLNLQSSAKLVELSAVLDRCCPGVPVTGSLIPASDNQFDTSPLLNYLTKPITLSKLKESLDSLFPSAKQVLIVDDDKDVQDLLSRMLTVINPGIRTVSLSSGEEALDYLAENQPPDLLLLDVILPDKNGFEVLEHLRQDNKNCQIPILFISAQDLTYRQSSSPVFVFLSNKGLSLKLLIESSIRLANLQPLSGTKLDLMPVQTAGV